MSALHYGSVDFIRFERDIDVFTLTSTSLCGKAQILFSPFIGEPLELTLLSNDPT
jgi:hypothetical protein